MRRPALALVSSLLLGAASAQMEKREDELYVQGVFASTKPAVGEAAPDLALADLAGRPWALGELRGRTVVLIKGGFT